MWDKGTLCITIAANIAKTGILKIDACFPDSVVGFIPNELTTTIYVQYWLSFLQKVLEDSAPESAQKNINLGILRGLELPIPPINSQKKFSSFIDSLEELKQQNQEKSQQLDNLFNALLQKAFKGELELKPSEQA